MARPPATQWRAPRRQYLSHWESSFPCFSSKESIRLGQRLPSHPHNGNEVDDWREQGDKKYSACCHIFSGFSLGWDRPSVAESVSTQSWHVETFPGSLHKGSVSLCCRPGSTDWMIKTALSICQRRSLFLPSQTSWSSSTALRCWRTLKGKLQFRRRDAGRTIVGFTRSESMLAARLQDLTSLGETLDVERRRH